MMEKIITFLATDGLELHGLLHQSGKQKCVLHVHGLGGNFYKDWYTELFVQLYQGFGYDYCTFNNRGSEFVKSLKYPKEDTKRWLGYSFELFEESPHDICGAIEYLKSMGYEEILLQGHSSGCQKILYTLSQQDLPEVSSCVFLSPCDDHGLLLAEYGKEGLEKRLERAKKEQGLIVDPEFFMGMPVSAETFLSHFHRESPFDNFHYHDLERPFLELEKNTRPSLVLFGEHDYVVDMEVIGKVFEKMNQYALSIIPEAGHKYDGCAEALSLTIEKWLRDTPSTSSR